LAAGGFGGTDEGPNAVLANRCRYLDIGIGCAYCLADLEGAREKHDE
jgi:hypothetical protein